MKKGKIRLGFTGVFLSLLILTAFAPVPSHAVETVWSDDFNDGNYDGWTVVNGTWSASGSMLKAIQDVSWGGYHSITYDSTVRRASRIFDFNMDDASALEWVIKIYPLATNLDNWGDTLPIGFVPLFGVCLEGDHYSLQLQETINNVTTTLDTYDEVAGFVGWHTINFTLGSNYNVTVHLDGELILNAFISTSPSPIYQVGIIPSYFYINAVANVTLDNIVVTTPTEPTTPTDTTTTTTTTPSNGAPIILDPMILALGGGAVAVLIIAIVIVKRR